MRSTIRPRARAWMGGMLLLAGTAAPVWGQQVIVPPAPVLVTSPVVTVDAASHQRFDPHVDKDLVSYSDFPSDTIRYYRFSTGVDTAIPSLLGWRDILSDVNGNLITFTRMSTTSAVDNIMVFNTATSVLTEIAPQVGGSARIGSALGGNTLAFAEFSASSTPGDIMAYDLAAHTLTNVSASPVYDQNPSVSPDGNTIVWERCISSLVNCDIAKAVRSGGAWTVSSVAATPSAEFSPDTDGTWIVYDAYPAGSPIERHIYFQPVDGGTETQLALAGRQTSPSLSQGVIAFKNTNISTGFGDIFVYVIATNALYQITATDLIDELFSDVSVLDNGDIRVVWTVDDGIHQTIQATTFTPFVFPLTRTLYGVNATDDGLSAINPTTGDVRFIGRLSGPPPQNSNRFASPMAMAVRPGDEQLFVWNNSTSNYTARKFRTTGELLTVDSCSARATPVRSETPPQGVLGSLAFAPDGTLFGLDDKLWRIDPDTGVATQVGSSLGLRIGGADFTPTGLLYGVELAFRTQRLVRINTVTGTATVAATLSENVGIIGSIVFNPATGKFLASSGRKSINSTGAILFDLDPATGMVSNVRTMGQSAFAQGLGFAPACITGPIAGILEFFEKAVAAGTLVGTGSGQSAVGHVGALRNMIRTAGEYLNQGNIAQACQQLKDVLDRTDGNLLPPDFVSGPEAATLATLIYHLRGSLDCK